MSDWPFSPEVENETGGWSVEASEEHYGAYYIEEAQWEQEDWPGEVEGDDEEARRLLIADQHDHNNTNLIAAAPRLYRLVKELLATEGIDQLDLEAKAKEVINWIDEGLAR